MFKRVMLVIACLFVMFSNQVSAANVKNFSDDEHIRGALTLLNDIGAEDVFNNLQENSVKIKFYDLSQLSYEYKDHFATNSTDTWGNRYILINTKYKNAPIEQIACLIAHESCHKGSVATLEEETTATRKEAQYWTILKKHNITYTNSDLLQRLESLKNLENCTTVSHDYIQERISNSSFYQNQLALRDRRKF